jgi:hypothetical protein
MAAKLLVAASAKASLVDFGVIESRIEHFTQQNVPRNIAFAKLVLRDVFGVPDSEIDDCIVDGGSDRGLDIVYVDHANKVINLASCKCVAKYKKSQANFPGDEVDKIISIVDDILYRNEHALSGANGALSAHIRQIWELLEADNFAIKVHLFSNQSKLVRDEKDRLVQRLSSHRAELYEHSLYELSHGVVRASKPQFQKRLKPLIGRMFEHSDSDLSGLQATVGLAELKQFLSNTDGEFDERLLSHNVRYFLGMDNNVNSAIRETILDGRFNEFWFLNNGITIVCDQVIGLRNGCHSINLKNPKIVNGGQTARVLFETLTNLLAKEGGAISVKIIETADESFIEKIAISSNSQSRIFGRDLRAFDPLQEKLALSVGRLGFVYKRKRSEKTDEGLKTIDMARAGQLLLAFRCGEPTLSKTAGNDIFEELYAETFDPLKTTGELIVSAYLCHQKIDKFRQEALHWQKSATRNSYAETWIIEGHFHVLFVVGELMRRQGIELTDAGAAERLVEEAVAIVETFVKRNPNVAAYRLFRLKTSKAELLEVMESMPVASPFVPIQLRLRFD